MLGLLIILAAGLALLWAVVVAWTAWTLAHPARRTYSWAVAKGRPGDPSELVPPRPFEDWTFADPRGRELAAWDVAGDDPDGPVIVLTHGWSDSRIGGLARVPALAPVASRLILWDMPGQGESPGRCTLGAGESAALGSLLEVLRGRGGGRGERAGGGAGVVLYGWSLGAGVSIERAGHAGGVLAVIAESPYRFQATPARNVLRARGLPHRLTLMPALVLARARGLNVGSAFRGFDRAADAARVRCPLLVIHGTEDPVSPVEDGRLLAGAPARGSIAEISGAGHNDLWTDPRWAARCAAAARAFVRDAVPRADRAG